MNSSTKEFKCNSGSILVVAVVAFTFLLIAGFVTTVSLETRNLVLTRAMEPCKGYNKNLKYRKLFIFQYLLSVELGSGWHKVHFDNFKLANAS